MSAADLLEQLRVANPVAKTDLVEIDDTALLAAIDERYAALSNVAHRTEPPPSLGDHPTVDYIQLRPDGSTAPAERKGWFGVVVAVAATILAVVGVVVAGGGNSGHSVSEPASTAAAETDIDPTRDAADPAPSPGVEAPSEDPTVVDGLGYRWSKVESDDLALGGAMWAVIADGPGYIAVGSLHEEDVGVPAPFDIGFPGLGGPLLWTSTAGVTWTAVPLDEEIVNGESVVNIGTPIVGGPGFVAPGSVTPVVGWSIDDSSGSPLAEFGDGDVAVFTSEDGIEWSRVPHDEAVFGGPGDQAMAAIVAGGPGLLAVGHDDRSWYDPETGAWTNDGSAAVWTSPDAITWSRVPHDEAVFGGEHVQRMSSVTVGGPGFVAVGSDSFAHDHEAGWSYEDFTGVAAVWTSVDGIEWSRVPHDEAVFGGDGNHWMSDVVDTGSGLVAVGGSWSSTSQGAAVWTSVDGLAWERVPLDEELVGNGGPTAPMGPVTRTDAGLIAVGHATDFSGGGIWTSVDGEDWSWLPGLSHPQMVISGGPGLIAVGHVGCCPPRGAAVWVGELDE